MNININCSYNDKGAWCKNEEVSKSFFGVGARCCKEFNGCGKCEFKEEYARPKAPPPPPKPPCRKVSGYFGILLNQDEIDKYEKDSAEWRENLENWRKQ